MVVTSIALRATTTRPILGDVELTQFAIALAIAMCTLLAWRTSAGALAVREATETSMILGLQMCGSTPRSHPDSLSRR